MAGFEVNARLYTQTALERLKDYQQRVYKAQLERAIRVRDRARELAAKAKDHDDRQPRLAPAVVVIEGEDAKGLFISVGVSSEYVPHGFYQEFGTSKMEKHPYMRPAVEENIH